MNYNGYVDIAIAFLFIILLLCIITSGINEVIMHALKTRGTFLMNAIAKVFNDKVNKNFAKMLYDHPVIDALKKDPKRPPSYISSDAFADSMIDLIGNEFEQKAKQNAGATPADDGRTEADLFKRFQKGVETLKHSDVKVLLRTIVEGSSDLTELKKNFAKWYDDYMDRVSGWYKQNAQRALFVIGLIVAVALNVDTFRLLSELNTNTTLRMQVANAAEQYIDEHQMNMRNADSLNVVFTDIDSTYKTLQAFDLPIGWNETVRKGGQNVFQAFWSANSAYFKEYEWIQTVGGWLITAGLLSFGAPFWFQLLNKLIDLRKSGKKPEQKNEGKG